MLRLHNKIFAFCFAAASSLAMGHARLADTNIVAPRNNDPGIKVGPCGGVAIVNSNQSFNGGQTITINWIETINHPGNYFIEVSAGGDTGWIRVKTVADNQDNNVLPHAFSTTIDVPNLSCTTCSMRLIQEMTDRAMPTYYYSCSQSFTIVQNAALPPASGGGGSASPDDFGGSDSNCK